jgi:hypothetical protein
VSVADDGPDMSLLRERRRLARRRVRLARLDLGLGVVGAIVLLLAAPGLAIAAVVACVLLTLCALSLAAERLAVRRSARRLRKDRAELARALAAPDPRRRGLRQ